MTIPIDQYDLTTVDAWLRGRNVSGWPVTSVLSRVVVDRRRGTIRLEHSQAGQWPVSDMGGIAVEGNPWLVVTLNGRRYAATWDWLRPGQIEKHMTAEELGRDQIREAPLDASWQPRPGDLVGFFVSTRARDATQAGNERSSVVTVCWPEADQVAAGTPDQAPVPPVPIPQAPAEDPVMQLLVTLSVRLDALGRHLGAWG